MKKLTWYQRMLVPLIFWSNLLKSKVGRLFRRPTKELVVPAELLPLLQVGTLAMRYSEFMEIEPESLKLSAKLHDIVNNKADTDSMLFVEKVLFGKDLFDTVYTWMVFLGDAHERDRELFKAYLSLNHKTDKKNT
jgi:hypothetical protein